MKLKYTFENVELDDETMAIPVGEGADSLHAVLRLNDTASDILKLLKNETTEEQVVAEMLKMYEADRDTMAKHVHAFVEKLQAAGVLA